MEGPGRGRKAKEKENDQAFLIDLTRRRERKLRIGRDDLSRGESWKVELDNLEKVA